MNKQREIPTLEGISLCLFGDNGR